MASLNLESITDQVRSLLQREIEAGKLAPGTRIHEAEFSERLGISKSPLRFALHQLKQDGIIRIEPRKGFFVAVPTKREIAELLEMREVLEGLAARRAASRADRAIVRRLEACVASFEEATVNDRQTEFFAANHRFHRLLAEASKSAELISSLKVINIRLHVNWLRAKMFRAPDLVPAYREHLGIIEAIRAGDADRAEYLAAAHVTNVPWATVMEDDAAVVEPEARAGASA